MFSLCYFCVKGELYCLLDLFFCSVHAFGLLLCFLTGLLDNRSHILHILKECHCEALAWKLLAVIHCPIAVLEVIVLHAAEFLDVAVATVVVCHEETVFRNDLSCATVAELDDSVLEG